jgi:autophagy-related protein 9
VGSLLVVLLGIGLYDDNALFELQVLPDKSAVWFVGIGGSIIALCRAVIPDENAVMEPEKVMEELITHTHYMPQSWRNRLHSQEVLTYIKCTL